MRILILISILLSFKANTFGQYKSYFGSESTSWNITYRSQFGNPQTDTIKLLEDTVFNNKVWYKINVNVYLTSGYLSEDTATGELFYKSNRADSSVICSKMNYTLTDSIFIGKVGNKKFYSKITDIYFDSLGNKHIVTDYATDFLPFMEFVEGVGSTHTMFWNSIDRVSNNYLLCVNQNGNKVYVNNTYQLYAGKCHAEDIIDNINELENSSVASLFPNPANEMVNIKLDNKHINEVLIFNSFGNLVLSKKEIEPSLDLDISGLVQGIYFIKIIDKEGTNYTKKLLKSNN